MIKTILLIISVIINFLLMISVVSDDKDIEALTKENTRLTRDNDLLRNKLNKMEKKKNAKTKND